MSMTGATLDKYFDQKISASYTGYLDPTKKNRLFKEALISICEKVYRKDFDIKDWDAITYITNTNVAVTPTNNLIDTAALQIIGVAITSGTVFTITTRLPHALVSGESVTISGVTGTAVNLVNVTAVATVTSSTTFTITVATTAGFAYTANSGVVADVSTITDYWHLLTIRPLFNAPIYGLKIVDATNRSPITVEVNFRNIIRSGYQIVISGVLGNTAANGTYYARVMNDFKFQLYSDVNLQVPVVGNGNYASGGIVSLVYNNIAYGLTSEMKSGVLNVPTVQVPYFEIANNQIKIYPLDKPCASVLMDYIRIPQVVIDVTDAVTDLTLYYPEKFLYSIMETAAQLFAIETRDIELLQVEGIEEQKNP